MANVDHKASLFFFCGSLLMTPIGYLVGVRLGLLLARSVAGLSSSEMASSSTVVLFMFGVASVAISTLHLLLFLFVVPRSSFGLPNTTHHPTGAPSGAGGR